jgi:hypothetical protein
LLSSTLPPQRSNRFQHQLYNRTSLSPVQFITTNIAPGDSHVY